MIAAYQSKIELLESRIDELERVLDEYEAPPLPEGSSFEIMIARKCMELLFKKRVICWFKGVSIDGDGYVVLRLKPTEGGQKAIEKWANHLHIEMELAENPKFATLRGAVQIWLKPQEMVRLPAIPDGDDDEYTPPPNHPSPNRMTKHQNTSPKLRLLTNVGSQDSDETDTRQRFDENSYEFDERLERFVSPTAKLPPYGAIRQMERDWVGYLWIYHEPPIRNQKHIIFKVWGYKSGEGDGFQSARRRLHTILKDAGITPRTWRKSVNE
ncbi:MAG: hypothetical protein PUP92_26660 [Rhizonema sp. PD38]|nr:hypothetical protein [Rhizonema sp. PD38]